MVDNIFGNLKVYDPGGINKNIGHDDYLYIFIFLLRIT